MGHVGESHGGTNGVRGGAHGGGGGHTCGAQQLTDFENLLDVNDLSLSDNSCELLAEVLNSRRAAGAVTEMQLSVAETNLADQLG